MLSGLVGDPDYREWQKQERERAIRLAEQGHDPEQAGGGAPRMKARDVCTRYPANSARQARADAA